MMKLITIPYFQKKSSSCIIFLISILLPVLLWSQETKKIWYNSVPIPPSPNSSALGFYGEVPVTKSTGIPSISIPLLNISEGGIEIPISLSYNASGIKVQQQETTVGLGWALNAGGVITRSVNGRPDDGGYLATYCMIPTYTMIMEYLHSVDSIEQNRILSWLDEVAKNQEDYEPDVYYYNFGNKSGYFMFGNHGDPIIFPHSDIKIEPTIINIRNLGGFTITDTDGKIYVFGGSGDDASSYIENTVSSHEDNSYTYASSWVLNKIIDKSTKTEIKFTYQEVTVYDETIASSTCSYLEYINGGPTFGRIGSTPSIMTTTITTKNITNISTSFGDVEFHYGNFNTKLESITFKSRKFIFNYTSFQEFTPSGGTINGRRKLDSIIEMEKDTLKTKDHLFYYEPGILPPRSSYAADLWGYYNGENLNTTFVPTTKVNGQLLPNANREPNAFYSKIGVLNKIIYPTGGYTQFIFENNSVVRKPTIEEIEASELLVYGALGTGQGSAGSGGGGLYSIGDSTILVQDSTAIISEPSSTVESNSNILEIESFELPQEVCEEYILNFSSQFLYKNILLEVRALREDEYCSEYNDYVRVSLEDPQGNIVLANDYINLNAPLISKLYINTLNGYKLTLCSPNGSCRAKAYLSFVKYDPTQLNTEIEVTAGGLRIKQLINYDPLTNISNTTEYKYEGGFYTSSNTAVSTVYNSGLLNVPGSVALMLNSSAGCLLGASSNVVSYWKVTEYKGRQDSNLGKIVTYYQKGENGDRISTPPYFFSICKQYLKSNPLKELIYDLNDSIVPIKSTYYIYENDINHSYSVKSFKVSRVRQNVELFKPLINIRECFVFGNAIYESDTRRLKSTITVDRPSKLDSARSIVNYFYDNNNHLNVTRTESILSDGRVLKTIYKYPIDYVNCDSCINENMIEFEGCSSFKACLENYKNCLIGKYVNEIDPNKKAILLMALKNMNNRPVETMNYINGAPTEHTKIRFDGVVTNLGMIPVAKEASMKNGNSDFYPVMLYHKYDDTLNITEVSSKTNGIKKSYIWGYKKRYLIAEVNNATVNEIGYSSFESESNGWINSASNVYDKNEAYNGKSSICVSGGYGPSRIFNVGNEANNHNGYQASVWVNGSQNAYIKIMVEGTSIVKTCTNNIGTGWSLLKVELTKAEIQTINSTLKIKVQIGASSGIANFDELRFCPIDAQMVTYTHEPFVGITSTNDANSRCTNYEYDGFGRLKLVRDYLGNILQKYDYNYKAL